MEEKGPPEAVGPPPDRNSAHMLDNTAVEVKAEDASGGTVKKDQRVSRENIVPPNPATPQPVRNHTGRTPLHAPSYLSARSSISSPGSRSSYYSAPGTPHILNQRYVPPEDGSTLGSLLTKYPILMWVLCCLTPLAYLLLMFGAIPIGERKDDDDKVGDTDRFHRYWVFTCVVNPINMMIIAFLNSGIFLSCMGVLRPFRVHWSIMLAVFVVEVIVFTVIVPFTGTFDFFGVAALFLCYAVTFLGMSFFFFFSSKCHLVSIISSIIPHRISHSPSPFF